MVRAGILALILLSCLPILAQVQDSLFVADSLSITGFEPEQEPEQTAALIVVEKSELLDWIDMARALTPRDDQLWLNEANIPMHYRFGSNISELHTDPYILKIHGFERPQSALGSAIFLDYFSRYHIFDYALGEVDGRHLDYDIPVTLSGLKGSLGDYDNRDVSAFIYKGDVFGFADSNLQLNYTLQNGYWLENPLSGSSMRPYLSYRYRDFHWAFEYASYQKEGSALELIPNYWGSSTYRLKHKYQHLYAHMQHPWLSLYFIKAQERLQSSAFQQSQNTSNLQLALQRRISLPRQRLDLRYEYADIDRDYEHVLSYNSTDYEHKLSLEIQNEAGLDLKGRADLLDWDRLRSFVKLKKDLGRLSIGLYDQRFWAERDSSYTQSNPVDGSMMGGLSINNDSETAIFSAWQASALNLSATVGYQEITQHSLLHDLSDQQLLLRLGAVYNPRFGDWELLIKAAWKMQDFSQYLMENPQFIFDSSQSLTRHLGHDNSLSAGFRLKGHSDYYLANAANPALVEASTGLDVWGEVKVSKLFDFCVSFQNLLDSTLFGVYPIPLSVHARLSWYFLN